MAIDREAMMGVLELMLERNLRIFSHSPGLQGYPITKASDIAEYLEDPDQYTAKVYGVSKQRLLAWMEYQKSPQNCLGTTSTGRRCRNHAYYSHKVTPQAFSTSNPDLYCHTHADQAGA